MHCLSHIYKGAHEVRGRCFTRDLGNAPRGPDYLARGCSGRKLLLVRGYMIMLPGTSRRDGVAENERIHSLPACSSVNAAPSMASERM